jgi:hypothetical protein
VPTQTDDSSSFDCKIVEFFTKLLPAKRTDVQAHIKGKDFSRERCLTLPVVLALLINMVRPGKRVGYQAILTRFFADAASHEVELPGSRPPDKAAFQRARHKVDPGLMREIFSNAVDFACGLSSRFESLKWNGFRTLAIDGTWKNMPLSPELTEFFGIPEGASRPQMLACTLFDVGAKIPIDGVAGPHDSSERELAKTLFDHLEPGKDLLLMDRGFPGFLFFHELIQLGMDFLARLPLNGLFGPVRQFLARGGRDGVVSIAPSADIERDRRRNGLPPLPPISLRIVKVEFPNDKEAVFATTLTDSITYLPQELADLYHLRWRQEEFFKLIKGLLEAENFRGKSTQLISQELLAIHLYCLLTRILILESAQINGISPDHIEQQAAFFAVSRVLDRIWTSKTLDECRRWIQLALQEIAWSKYKPRPNRSFPRKFRR